MTESNFHTDNQLLQLLCESNHSAYNEIFRRYFSVIYIHAYKKLRDEEQAKDVVQEVFTTLWINRETIASITNLAAYLFTAVRNRVFDLFAHEQVRGRYMESLVDYLDVHGSVPTDYRVRERQMPACLFRSSLPGHDLVRVQESDLFRAHFIAVKPDGQNARSAGHMEDFVEFTAVRRE